MLNRHVGTVLMIFSAVHAIVTFVLFGDWLLLVARGGVGNLMWTPETLAAFWFLVFSWPVYLLGYVVNWAHAKTGQLPPKLGRWTFIVPAVSLGFSAGVGAVALRPLRRARDDSAAARRGAAGA